MSLANLRNNLEKVTACAYNINLTHYPLHIKRSIISCSIKEKN